MTCTNPATNILLTGEERGVVSPIKYAGKNGDWTIPGPPAGGLPGEPRAMGSTACIILQGHLKENILIM